MILERLELYEMGITKPKRVLIKPDPPHALWPNHWIAVCDLRDEAVFRLASPSKSPEVER